VDARLDKANLTERQRDVLARWCWDGQRQTDIAAELGISQPTVHHIISRAQRKLVEAGLPRARRLRQEGRPQTVSPEFLDTLDPKSVRAVW